MFAPVTSLFENDGGLRRCSSRLEANLRYSCMHAGFKEGSVESSEFIFHAASAGFMPDWGIDLHAVVMQELGRSYHKARNSKFLMSKTMYYQTLTNPIKLGT